MTISLAALRAEADFPLFAIHPRHWIGTAFVSNVARDRGPSWLHTVQLTYLDARDPAAGALVSNLAAPLVTEDKVDPLEAHLLGFVAHFEPRFLKRFMRSGASPVTPGDFDERELTLMVAGQERGAWWLRHKDLPLDAVRTAIRIDRGVTDVVVAGWSHPARDLAALLEPVAGDVAAAFDGGRARAPYPPPEWGTPPG